jgi:serine protease Do
MRRFKPFVWILASAIGMGVLITPLYAADFPDFTQLVENYSKAVVSINATGEQRTDRPDFPPPSIPEDSPFHDYFKRFFEQLPDSPPRSSPLASVGSGFIISADGYVLTNAHVIQGTDKIVVGLSDRSELSAKVVGKDERSDIALLKIESKDELPTVDIGDSKQLQVGQWVLAIGSPFGFEHTATQGIISALGRSLPRDNYVPFIQTDAAVNPGNSGGPLFNLDGKVIGVNSQIYSRSGGYQGVSFAIPIDVAMDVANQLRTEGKVSRGWLGVLIQEVTMDLARSFGLDKPQGALVGQVITDSPAQKAGVQAGDIITTFGDQPINHSSELPPMVGRIRPGAKIPLNVIRNNKQQTISVTIEELPDNPRQQALSVEPALSNRLKLKVVDDPEVEEGVKVEEVEEGPAASAGIQPGDIIMRLNNKKIDNAQQFEETVKQLPTGTPFPILVQRGEGALFLALTLPQEEKSSQ